MIELLAVVSIIVVLIAIVVKATVAVYNKSGRSQTVGILESINHALAEYYEVYGQYPPVDYVAYEYENTNTPSHQTPWFHGTYLPNHDGRGNDSNPYIYDMQLRYGLVSYLDYRARPHQFMPYLEDEPHHIQAKRRWEHYINGIVPNAVHENVHTPDPAQVGSRAPYTNNVDTVHDAWGHEIVYRSHRPFQSYDLFSVGPDGQPGTHDDVNADRWNQ
jgi:hypothetical protein